MVREFAAYAIFSVIQPVVDPAFHVRVAVAAVCLWEVDQ